MLQLCSRDTQKFSMLTSTFVQCVQIAFERCDASGVSNGPGFKTMCLKVSLHILSPVMAYIDGFFANARSVDSS